MAAVSSFPDDFERQQLDIMQRRKKAQEGQQFNAMPGQMVSGHYVAPHFTQILAEGLRGYSDIQGEKKADQELKDLTGKRQTDITNNQTAYIDALRGKKAVETPTEMFVADDAGGGEMTMGTQVTPAIAPDPYKAYGIAMKSPDANMRQMGTTQFSQYQQNQATQQQKLADQQAADAKIQAQKDQQTQLWEQSGGNPQAFLAAGGDFEFANNMVSGQNMGKAKVARTIETTDPQTGRKINVMVDEYGNRVGDAMPVYTPPKAGPTAPSGYRYKRDGSLEPIPGGPADPKNSKNASNVTEGERKAGTLLTRLRGSQAQLADVTAKNPSAASPSFIGQTLSGMGMETAGNLLTSSDRQRVNAAQLDLLDAALTLGTGAAYTKEQLQGYQKSFFPQIGDSPETIRDKEERLKNVIASAEIAAGRVEPESVPRFGPQSRPGPTPQNASQQKRIRFDSQGNIIP